MSSVRKGVLVACVGGASCLSLAPPARAQMLNPARRSGAENAVALGAGLENGSKLELGYARFVSVPGLPQRLAITGRLELPFSPGIEDWQLSGGAFSAWLSDAGWGIRPGFRIGARHTRSALLEMAQIALAPSVAAGHFRDGWMAAVVVAWDRPIATYVSTTEVYRRRAYPEASGGWYGSGGGIVSAGLEAGVGLGARSELGLRLGAMWSDQLVPVAGLPFYGVVGFAQRF